MSKRARRTRDKWREKKWVRVEAPSSFGNAIVAQIPITDPDTAVGRVLEMTLYDLMKQDPQQYVTKLRFQIVEIIDSVAKTILQGHEYSREYLRSLVRRGSSLITYVDDFDTRDGAKVRVHVIAFAQGRINASRMHAIRMTTKQVLAEKAASLTYDQFAQEAVLQKIASDIYNSAKKITILRHVGLRKTKLIRKPTEQLIAATETPSSSPAEPSVPAPSPS